MPSGNFFTPYFLALYTAGFTAVSLNFTSKFCTAATAVGYFFFVKILAFAVGTDIKRLKRGGFEIMFFKNFIGFFKFATAIFAIKQTNSPLTVDNYGMMYYNM